MKLKRIRHLVQFLMVISIISVIPIKNVDASGRTIRQAHSHQLVSGSERIYLPLAINNYNPSNVWPALRTVNAPYFNAADVVDEHFNEMAIFWYGKIAMQDAYTDMRVGYNDTALFFRAQIFDRQLWYDLNPSPETLTKWDAISVVVDKGGSSDPALSTSSYRFIAQLNPLSWNDSRYKATYRGSSNSWNQATIIFTAGPGWRGQGYNSSDREARGWIMYYKIPFASLGLSRPPDPGTVWRLGVTTYNRNDAAGTPIPPDTWPESLDENQPSTWGALRFGLPSFTAPSTRPAGTTVIRNKLNGAVVVDAAVGGTIDPGGSGSHLCPGDSSFIWNQWGEMNFGGAEVFNVQNQGDVADWPCYAKYYITFPLDQIPQGKTILSAKLTLYKLGGSDPTLAKPSYIQVFTVGDEWSEASLNWNNAPLALENVSQLWVSTTIPEPFWPGLPWDWDMTRAVAQARQAGMPYLRLAIYEGDWDYHSGKYFVSSDIQDWNAIGRPTLTIDWANR